MIGSALSYLDGLMAGAGLAAEARLIVWGIVGGAAVMGLYALVSPQQKLAAVQREANEARQAMLQHEGDLKEGWALMGRSIALALKRLALAVGPSLLAGLPVLVLLIWMSGVYAHRLPQAGTRVGVEVRGVETSAVHWRPTDAATLNEQQQRWRVRWPSAGEAVTLTADAGRPVLRLPIRAPAARVTPPRWWHGLFAPPGGVLPEDSRVTAVHVDLPPRALWPGAPGWLQPWWVTFLGAVPVTALTVKLAFRIH
jgi:hypothetical protein